MVDYRGDVCTASASTNTLWSSLHRGSENPKQFEPESKDTVVVVAAESMWCPLPLLLTTSKLIVTSVFIQLMRNKVVRRVPVQQNGNT